MRRGPPLEDAAPRARGSRTAFPRLLPSLVLLALTACVTNLPPPEMVPTGTRVQRPEELSGDYCYYGRAFNVRSYGRTVESIHFIPVAELQAPTRITVEASEQRVVFLYTGADGSAKRHLVEVQGFAKWKEGSVVVEGSSPAIPLPAAGGFQIESAYGRSEIFKLADGRLVMTDTAGRKGYSEIHHEPSFHRDEVTAVLILNPATGDCDDLEGRQLQPWFEHGLDLRLPACAAELENQIASILVEKKVDAEAAARAAGEAVGPLVTAGSTQGFSASPEPDDRYEFRIVRKKSGCVLKLAMHYRKHFGISSHASRPLPACVCNE
jgi:hypothetical protein